ncbi:3-dehydroquinate dehydratase [Clostridia bacterium]|nr:3-dehydroquinate dehydratase [Clostridia bacterium]
MKIYVINGPNLNMLGTREPEVYGKVTLRNIIDELQEIASQCGAEVVPFQSNAEGEIIDMLHNAYHEKVPYVLLNAGAFSHYSYAVADAIEAIKSTTKTIEVHISNIYARDEEFRHHSVLSRVCSGVICGFGKEGYVMALRYVLGEK